MYDFLRKPRWVLSHVLIAVLVVTMVGLGFWQMSRWQEEADKQELLETRTAAAPVPLDAVVEGSTDPGALTDDVDYRRVTVTGRYDADGEVAIRNRTFDGAPGAWVLTPLVQDDGTAVAVLRGWVPLDAGDPQLPYPGAEAPSDEVTVTGLVRRTQERGSVGPTDPAAGELTNLARVDLERLGQQYDTPLEPVWIQADGQTPAAGELPAPVDIEIPTPSQNVSYMVQWWIFALIAAAGYPLVLRRVAHNRTRQDQVPVDDEMPSHPTAAEQQPESAAGVGNGVAEPTHAPPVPSPE